MHALEDQIQAAQDDNGIGVAVDNQKLDEYHKMLASAQKLHEEETQRQEERKRRKEQRNAEMFERKQKVEAEATRIKAWADRRATCSTELSRLFSDLQAVSSDNNLGLRCPELVVVGMQSDGKSTFVEALLGFSFNIVSSNIGTRRPLIISMVNSRTYAEPCCRFRLENVPAGASGADEFENKPTPVERLSDEIQRRTNDVAGSDKSRVSSKPIFLRVEYSNCANLTIYDTPGFRLHGDERLASEIHDMVIDLIRPPERIIVCLEQSTVEWANTSSRRLVQQVDPDYSRTILLHTKFDNRIKVHSEMKVFTFSCSNPTIRFQELRSADEGLKYLHGEGLPRDDIPNFFISLPVARDLPPPAFREAVNSCYLQDFAHLQRIGIEDKQILAKLGFCRVEAFLERQMTRRYQAAFLPTLESLERGVAEMTTRIETLDRNIAQKDPNVMRQRAAHYVNVVTGMIER
jgi:GTPase SAR1 family protein